MIIGSKSTVDDLFTEAAAEGWDEQVKAAKDRIKVKLRNLAAAKQAVRNIELELEDLRRELEETL